MYKAKTLKLLYICKLSKIQNYSFIFFIEHFFNFRI